LIGDAVERVLTRFDERCVTTGIVDFDVHGAAEAGTAVGERGMRRDERSGVFMTVGE
jgi:hypothetical protein